MAYNPISRNLTIDQVITSKDDPTKLFDLIEELAVGSYGHVYRAVYKPTGETCALKIIALEEDDTFEEMMIEIQVLERCVGHNNIVKYVGSWKKGDELFIAMELCGGGSANDLYQILEAPLQEPQIAWITQESLKGLAFLHDRGIIHRDIKAANILLTETGDVKLTDFGVSAQMEHPKDKRRTFIGTPYWIAPEVVNTVIAPYDEKCDIWSLGITCIELAELQPPLHEIAPMTAVMQIPKNPPPQLKNPRQWSPEFNDFLKECFIKDPTYRKSATELLKHPFFKIAQGDSGQCLIPLIRRTRAAEEAYSHGGALPPDIPEPLPEESPPGSPLVDDYGSSIITDNGDLLAQLPPMNVGLTPEAPSSPMSPSRSGIASTNVYSTMTEEEKRKALHEEKERKNSLRERQKRPTLTRTLKRENLAMNQGKKKVLKQQLKQLRKLMKSHEQQQQRQLKQHQLESETLQAQHQQNMTNKHKELGKKQKVLKRSQLVDVEELIKTQATEIRGVQKQNLTDKKKIQKDIKEDQKRLLKNFEGTQKDKRNQYNEKKKNLKKSKEELKKLETEFKNDAAFQLLCFNQKIAMEERLKEDNVTLLQQRQQCQRLREQHIQLFSLQYRHFKDLQMFERSVLETQQEMERDLQGDEISLETKQQAEQQELQKQQILAHHRLLAEQQARQLLEDEKDSLREFKNFQRKQAKEHSLRMKQQREGKDTKRRQTMDFKKKLQQDEVDFLQQAMEKRKSLQTELEEQQSSQMEILVQQHGNAQVHLKDEQAERKLWLITKHNKQNKMLAMEQYAQREKFVIEHHAKQLQLVQNQQEELLKVLTELQDSELLLQGTHEKALEGKERILEEGEEQLNDLSWLKEKHNEQTNQLVQEFQQLQNFLLKSQTEELEALYNENPSQQEDNPPTSPGGAAPNEKVADITEKVTEELLNSDSLSEYSQVLGTLKRLNN